MTRANLLCLGQPAARPCRIAERMPYLRRREEYGGHLVGERQRALHERPGAVGIAIGTPGRRERAEGRCVPRTLSHDGLEADARFGRCAASQQGAAKRIEPFGIGGPRHRERGTQHSALLHDVARETPRVRRHLM